MKQKYVNMYMDWASRAAEISHAKRLQVGAVIVKDDSVISYGYNGMPSGWDNNCEQIVGHTHEGPVLKTKPEVLHAESNAIAKLAKSTESGDGASMFITCAPCIDCAKMIYQAGIKEVFYDEDYKNTDGIEFLHKCKIPVRRIDDKTFL